MYRTSDHMVQIQSVEIELLGPAYQVLPDHGNILQGHGLWVTMPWTILWQAIDHMLYVSALCTIRTWICFTGLWTICYRALDHNILCRWPCVIRPWTYSTRWWTILYLAIDHVVQSPVPFATGPWNMGTRPWIIMYWAIDLMLQGYVACASKPLTCSTGTWPWFTRFRMNGMANYEFRSTRKTNCSATTKVFRED